MPRDDLGDSGPHGFQTDHRNGANAVPRFHGSQSAKGSQQAQTRIRRGYEFVIVHDETADTTILGKSSGSASDPLHNPNVP